MKINRKIIEIDEALCDGCGQCVPNCAEGALQIVEGKARLVAERYCDGLGACLGDCPTGALQVVERLAEDFDEAAVEAYLQQQKESVRPAEAAPPREAASAGCACASAQVKSFVPLSSLPPTGRPIAGPGAAVSATPSALGHWPVKIRLVPPTAPFLHGADLLVAADCTPLAYPDFHREFLQGKAVLSGCPKFDDVNGYVSKFAEIFSTAAPRSITMVIMEVPCCGGMRMIVREAMQQAMQQAGRRIPVTEVVVGVRGDILRREQWSQQNP